MNLLRLLVLAGLATLLLGSVTGSSQTELRGSVGPGFTIALTDASGSAVTHLDPGSFSLTVDDKATDHNFHLMGPAVDVQTTVDEVAARTFSLNLVDGKYTFICDAHPTRMAGSFTVGTAPTPTPAPAAPKRLVLTVTQTTVALTTPAGKPVKALTSGPASVTVRDRSAARGAQLSGAGMRRSTSASFTRNRGVEGEALAGDARLWEQRQEAGAARRPRQGLVSS